jgi:galactokinase
VRRALASSEYNVRRSQCEEAVSILSAHLPGIRTLRDVSPEAFEGLAYHLPIVLRRRAQHVIEECQRVLQGADFLKRGDVQAFGRLIQRSHTSARHLYEVSIPELDLLAETAWQAEGCYGARLTGAGFGGCVVILAETKAAKRIKRILQEAFGSTYERDLDVFETSASQGVQVMGV